MCYPTILRLRHEVGRNLTCEQAKNRGHVGIIKFFVETFDKREELHAKNFKFGEHQIDSGLVLFCFREAKELLAIAHNLNLEFFIKSLK